MGELHEHVSCAPRLRDREKAVAAIEGLSVGELLGGGCIAQVYRGTLARDGEELDVAVKVRREKVVHLMDSDIKLLRMVAKTAEWLNPELQWLSMQDALDNFGWYLVQQLDLRVEAEHLTRFADDFGTGGVKGGRISVPKVFAATEAVLVTEIAQGTSLSQFVKQPHPEPVKNAVFTALIDAMARMVLLNNFIHGDLHPGNVLIFVPPSSTSRGGVGDSPVISLIDAGIAIQMTPNLTDFMGDALRAAFRMKPLGLGRAVLRLHQDEGLCTHGKDLDGLEHDVGYLLLAGAFMCSKDIWGEIFDTYEEYRGSRVSEYFSRLIALLSEHRVRISPSLWSVMTAFALIEGSVAELGYGINVLRAATPYLFKQADVKGRFSSLVRLFTSERDHREGNEK